MRLAILGVFLILGCGGEDEPSIDEFEEEVTSCTKAQVAYGEIRSFAIKSQYDFSAPSGLADAIASIFATCQRNPNSSPNSCVCADGSSASAPADQAAWNNILNNLNGIDRSNNAAYFCVGTQNCAIVNKCTARPGSGFAESVSRKFPLPTVAQTPIGTQNLISGQTGSIFYYTDPANGNCQIFRSIQVCESITPGTASNDYTYTCKNATNRTTFSTWEQVWVLARFTDLWRDHRFKVDAYRNGVYQWPYETPLNDVGQGGWKQAYFWPSLSNGLPGNWQFKIFIDYGTGYKPAASKSFTIQ